MSVEGAIRLLRKASASGPGLLWALTDEESLAFHYRISRTYPVENGSSRALVPQQR
jgi:hypothetical protein